MKWCEAAAEALIEEVGQREAIKIVDRFREIPSGNSSLNETLSRLHVILEDWPAAQQVDASDDMTDRFGEDLG